MFFFFDFGKLVLPNINSNIDDLDDLLGNNDWMKFDQFRSKSSYNFIQSQKNQIQAKKIWILFHSVSFSFQEPARYEFEYMVNDAESGNDFGHKESREGDMARGVYYVLLPDGRRQTVEYEADENGYRPKVTYTDEGGAGSDGNAAGGGNGGYRY